VFVTWVKEIRRLTPDKKSGGNRLNSFSMPYPPTRFTT
jgi:hypothetical protein